MKFGTTIKNKNFCVNLFCSTKKDYFETLNTKKLIYDKKFLKIFKSLRGNKVLNSNNEKYDAKRERCVNF